MAGSQLGWSILYIKSFEKGGSKSLEDKRFRIKEMLIRNILTQTWLVHQLKRHGVQTDQTELSAVLNGRRKGNKATKIMITSLNILNDYEEKMDTKGA